MERIQQLEQEIESLKQERNLWKAKFNAVDHEMGRVAYALDRIRDHFENDEIKGDGKWRLNEIGRHCRAMFEAETEAVNKLNALAAPPNGPV